MNPYFQNLIARNMTASREIQPRLASRFEPEELRQNAPDATGVDEAFLPTEKPVREAPDIRRDPPAHEGIPFQQTEVPVYPRETKTPVKTTARPDSFRPGDEKPQGASSERVPVPATITDASPAIRVASKKAPSVAKPPKAENAEPLPLPFASNSQNKREASPAIMPQRDEQPVKRTAKKQADAPLSKEPYLKTRPAASAALTPAFKTPDIRPLSASQESPRWMTPEGPTAGQEAPAEKTIKITIGRIDVRAVFPPPATPTKEARPKRSSPQITLHDYLQKQRGGSR